LHGTSPAYLVPRNHHILGLRSDNPIIVLGPLTAVCSATPSLLTDLLQQIIEQQPICQPVKGTVSIVIK
jgi:hypothetical protein